MISVSSKKKIKKVLEFNENESITYQNLRGKFIAMNAYIKNTERSQINHLHLKFLEKQEQAKPKTSRGREIIKSKNPKSKIPNQQNGD
jgi:hypothetical protein